MKEIWAFVEISGESILRGSREALAEAVRQGRQLRLPTTALVLGHGISGKVLEAVGVPTWSGARWVLPSPRSWIFPR